MDSKAGGQQGGPKVRKTRGKKAKRKQDGDGKERHNRKAFTFSGGKKVQQGLDKTTKKDHVPILDKTPEVAPPYVVVIQGPRGCGKTTLMKSLIRHYTKQNIANIEGSVTVVISKHRRITLYECPDDMASMIDVAKVADLAICMIDASRGLEMETFEFINLMQQHGMPKVIGCLSHLDKFPETKTTRKKKKEFKKRFWEELHDGAKLFTLSGLQYGRYPKTEVMNLARYIGVQKVPMLSWRNAHPYIFGTRWEDETDPTLQTDRRRIALYGYTYGARMRTGQMTHLCGVGDFRVCDLKLFSDPCPSPLMVEYEKSQMAGRDAKELKGALDSGKPINHLRTLADKHRAVYAPGCDYRNVYMDKDSMYITLPKHTVGFTKNNSNEDDDDDGEEEDEEALPAAVKMVRDLQNNKGALKKLVDTTEIKMFAEDQEPCKRPEDDDDRRFLDEDAPYMEDGKANADENVFGDTDEEDEDEASDAEDEEDEEEAAYKAQFLQDAETRFGKQISLESRVYDDKKKSSAEQQRAAAGGKKTTLDFNFGCDKPTKSSSSSSGAKQLFSDSDSEDEGKEKKTPGSVEEDINLAFSHLSLEKKKHPKTMSWFYFLNLIDHDGFLRCFKRMDDELDFAEKCTQEPGFRSWIRSHFFATGMSMVPGAIEGEEDDAMEGAEAEGGAEKKKGGNEEEADKDKTDEALEQAKQKNMVDIFLHQDAIPIGSFVKIVLEDVPALSVGSLSIKKPMILGGLLPGELTMGMLQFRVKKHRWTGRVLKSHDPMILSIGWRRFQTMPMYSLEDRDEKRMRFLKYTPDHMEKKTT